MSTRFTLGLLRCREIEVGARDADPGGTASRVDFGRLRLEDRGVTYEDSLGGALFSLSSQVT